VESLVGERWPRLARQLTDALARDGEDELAAKVGGLRVVQRCGCGDGYCQSFYTQAPPDGSYPMDEHRNWYSEEPGWEGQLILDVVDSRIAYVEVLYRSPLD
jgi:hypothetical protein